MGLSGQWCCASNGLVRFCLQSSLGFQCGLVLWGVNPRDHSQGHTDSAAEMAAKLLSAPKAAESTSEKLDYFPLASKSLPWMSNYELHQENKNLSHHLYAAYEALLFHTLISITSWCHDYMTIKMQVNWSEPHSGGNFSKDQKRLG